MEVNFNRKTIISFPNNTSLPDIETGIVDGSLFLDEVLFADRFTIGECHANRFEVDLYDYEQIDKGEKIYVYQLIDGTDEEPIFTGYVDSCVTNRGRFEDTKHVIAYDSLYSKGTVDVAKWWEDTFDTVSFITVKQLRESLCDYVEIPYESVNLPNDDVQISHTQQITTISFQAVLQYILTVNGVNANIDREGILRFFDISSNAPIVIDETYAQNTTEFDNYIVPPFQSVEIYNTTEGTNTLVGSETNILHITDNLLLLNKKYSDLATIAETILNRVISVTYKPAQIDMIYSQLNVKIGDKIQIGGNTYLVCENTLSGPQLVDQHISSIGAGEIEEASPTHDATQADMQAKISASSLKYYTFTNKEALIINNNIIRPIIQIKYTTSADTLIAFHGCVIIDVERVDTSQPGVVELSYVTSNIVFPDYHPTETYYHDGRYTLNLLYYWEVMANKRDTFKVNLQAQNCKVTIQAFKTQAYLEGMGIIGKDIWDGIIDIEDEQSVIEGFATTPSEVIPYEDEVSVRAVAPIHLSFEDEVTLYNLSTTPTAIKPHEQLYINKQRMSGVLWADLLEYTWQDVEDNFLW